MELIQENRLRNLAIFVFICLLLAIVWICCMQFIFFKTFPENSFLFTPSDRFMDFVNPMIQCRDLDPYFDKNTSAPSNLFPLNYAFLLPFTWLPENWAVSTFLGVVILGAVFLLGEWVKLLSDDPKQHLRLFIYSSVVVFGSYPFLFAFDRGNFDLIIFLICGLGILAFFKERYQTSAILLMLAAFAKGYPGIYLLLLLERKRYRELSIAFALTVAINFITLMALGGISHTVAGLFDGLKSFKEIYVIGNASMHYSIDFYNMAKILYKINLFPADPVKFPTLFTLFGGMVLFFSVTVFFLNASWPSWRKIAVLTIPVLFFPLIGNDYKALLMLFPSLALCVTKEAWTWKHTTIFLLSGLMLVPKNYIFLFDDVSISCILNPVLIALLFLLTATNIFEGKRLHNAQQSLNNSGNSSHCKAAD
jgi:hypothetical protein